MSEYYVQDVRSYSGNSILWWAKDGHGYTTDVRKAQIFKKNEMTHLDKDTFRKWNKKYIDDKISHTVDIQHLDLRKSI